MKSKLFLLSFLVLFTFTTNYAQTSASQSGIAVQGIARNSNNTALTSSTVRLSFQLYYNDVKTGNRVPIDGVKEVPLDTDAFGVFSHVIPVLPINFSLIANNAVHLTILDSKKETISDELLKQVPYAIAASNGVPTGCIMPYVGEFAPDGWVLCQGQDLKGDVRTAILRDLLGSDNAPDLGGRFLKGTGTPSEANVDVIILNNKQDQQTRTVEHKHSAGDNLVAKDNTAIGTNKQVPAIARSGGGGYTSWSIKAIPKSSTYENNLEYPYANKTFQTISSESTVHGHKVTGTTGGLDASTQAEIRPSSYGVNYIIKL
jgi:microcystin-dependent protein